MVACVLGECERMGDGDGGKQEQRKLINFSLLVLKNTGHCVGMPSVDVGSLQRLANNDLFEELISKPRY